MGSLQNRFPQLLDFITVALAGETNYILASVLLENINSDLGTGSTFSWGAMLYQIPSFCGAFSPVKSYVDLCSNFVFGRSENLQLMSGKPSSTTTPPSCMQRHTKERESEKEVK